MHLCTYADLCTCFWSLFVCFAKYFAGVCGIRVASAWVDNSINRRNSQRALDPAPLGMGFGSIFVFCGHNNIPEMSYFHINWGCEDQGRRGMGTQNILDVDITILDCPERGQQRCFWTQLAESCRSRTLVWVFSMGFSKLKFYRKIFAPAALNHQLRCADPKSQNDLCKPNSACISA